MTRKRLSKMMYGHRKFFIIGLLAGAFSALASMATPLITRITIDNVLNDLPVAPNHLVMWLVNLLGGVSAFQDNIWLAALAHGIFASFMALFIFTRGRLMSVGGENVAKVMKDKLYDHIQKLPYDYHTHVKTGDLIQRCTSDVETTRRFIQMQTVEIARAVFFTVFSIAIMLTINVQMTLVTFAFVPIIFLFSFVFFKKVRKTFKLADEKEGELTSVLQESLSGVRVVRAFGMSRHEVDKFTKKNREFQTLGFRQMEYLAWYWSSTDLLCLFQAIAVFVFGIFLTYNGQLTTGELLLFNIYVGSMIWPIRQLGRTLSDMGRMQVALERIYEILDTPIEKDTPNATEHNLMGDIVFKNVSFSYGDGHKIFDNISFEIKKGETIALLGATGVGKSTLMHILLRLYDFQEGEITINGKDLRSISKKCLREKIGIVLQEPFLYSKTIENNLKMAKNEASKAEILEATKTASAHHFIEEFEKGYETMVGERGVTLSGGQKQRVAIARTLIKESEMLVFDDSLSAVDTETDAQIRAALSEKNTDTTTFIISQRITTLMNASRIFVIENAKLSDSGTHEELISREGLYSKIWNIQSMLEHDFDSEVN